MEHKNFHTLPCNANLTVNDCSPPTSPNYNGFLSSSIQQIVIPCGKCSVVDTTDGSTLSFTNGIDIQGMLYFPSTANVTVETTHVFVQGTLKVREESIFE